MRYFREVSPVRWTPSSRPFVTMASQFLTRYPTPRVVMTGNDVAGFERAKLHAKLLKDALHAHVTHWVKDHPSAGPVEVMAALAELACEIAVASNDSELAIG